MVEMEGWDLLTIKHRFAQIWPLLESLGWHKEFGPRGILEQVYYMPPGIYRGMPGLRPRVDFFDSQKGVLKHVLESPALRERCGFEPIPGTARGIFAPPCPASLTLRE